MPSFQVNVDLTFSKGFFISGITTDFISDEWYTFSALTSLYFIIMPSVKAFIYEQKKKTIWRGQTTYDIQTQQSSWYHLLSDKSSSDP